MPPDTNFLENGYPFDARACCGYFLAMGNASPIAGVDYPRTFDEMDEWFRTDAQCRDYIRRLCWPNGFDCERSGIGSFYGTSWLLTHYLNFSESAKTSRS